MGDLKAARIAGRCQDRHLSAEIEAVVDLVRSGAVRDAAAAAVGPLA